MSPNKSLKITIQDVIKQLMDRVLDNVLYKDPFVKEEHRATKPLYAALVPDEIFKGSHFERRFVTPFGHVWETLAKVVAIAKQGVANNGYNVSGNVKSGRLKRITEVLNTLEHPKSKGKRIEPCWNKELKYILEAKGNDVPVSVICDLYTENTVTGLRSAYEIKAPLPNSDQTKVSKEKMLKLYAMEPRLVDRAYYALPYNPYGKNKKDYNWGFPARWFNMLEDEVVLIGNEFWDTLGGEGTYSAFIGAVNEIGPEYKEIIYRKFLGIEPPVGFDQEL